MSYSETIRKEMMEMWQLVQSQLTKSCQAFAEFDQDLAREIILIEERVDCCQLLIDKDCELFIALSAYRTADLPFAMAVLKTNRHLERIGDIATDIANEVIESRLPCRRKLVEETKILSSYGTAIKMLDIARTAFEEEDPELAQLVLKRCKYLAGCLEDIEANIKIHLKKNPDDISTAVHIMSIVRNLAALEVVVGCLAGEMNGRLFVNSGETITG